MSAMYARRVFFGGSLLAFLVASQIAVAQVTGTALVRHAPSISGSVDGSVQQMTAESMTLRGGGVVTGDLFVPGTPEVRLNGQPNYAGTLDGVGSASPTNHQITLNGNSTLRHVVRRTNAIPLPGVSAPPAPQGTRAVTITSSSQGPGSFGTLEHLTLNGNVGQFAIPPGSYGEFTSNGGSGFTLGVAGATQPAVYNFQRLTLNGQTLVQVIGPVIISVANGFTANGTLGAATNPSWLTLNVYSGGFRLNGGCTVYGYVNTPNGGIVVEGNSQLIGGVTSDELTVIGGGLIRLVTAAGGANRPPVASNAAFTLDEDESLAVALSATDADGNGLTYTVLTAPTRGSLAGAPPNLVYTPGPNYHGSDSFTFKASDGLADSNVATVSLTIVPVNDRPVAESKTLVVAEDTPASVILTGSDSDADPLTFAVVTPPANGALSGSGPNRVYTPAVNYRGTDAFSYIASDGTVNSTPATIAITVTPVNDPPTANSSNFSVNEGGTLAITLTGADSDGDSLTFNVLTQPSRGLLTGTPPQLTYVPQANFSGTDSFTFRAFDGTAESAPANIIIQVTNLNDPPIATSRSITTAEDTSVAIVLTGADPDGDAITFQTLAPPQHGTLSGAAPNLTYTPTLNYSGTDSFTFRTRDPSGAESSVATVSLTVTPVNDAPVAHNQTLIADEDTSLAITLTGSDIEGSTLSYMITVTPQHGTLTGTAPSFTYTPAPNYHGPDVFKFRVSDGSLNSTDATIALTVRPVNDAPAAIAQSLATNEDTPLVVTLSGTDVEGSPLTFEIATPPAHGTVTFNGPPAASNVYTYTPAANFHGPDSFTFKANDGQLESAPATVTISIAAQNDAPVATGQNLTQPQNTPFNFTLSATDADGQPLTYTIVTLPSQGVLTGTAPNLTYTPNLNYRGTDSLVFRASDGLLTSNTATITFTMTLVNGSPVASSQSVTLPEDSPTTVLLGATDPDGDALTYTIVTPPQNGTLAPVPGTINAYTYSPQANFHGTDTFTFKASDGGSDSNIATVSLTITPVNDPPIASAQAHTLAEDTSVNFTLTATDVDGGPLTYTIVAAPARGSLSGTAPNLAYTPAANFAGNDSFTFRARDGIADSNLATVSFTITPVNDAPVALAQSVITPEDTPRLIALTGTDTENSPLTYIVLTPPTRGTLTGTAPNLTYTPTKDYSGSDSFSFKVNDGSSDSSAAVVAVSVTPVNDAPIANPQTVVATTGAPKSITLTGSDVDSPTFTFAIVTPPQRGTVTTVTPGPNNTATVTYTSAPDFGGFDSFTFATHDGLLSSTPATVQITSGLPPRSRTYTTTADFSEGTLFAIDTEIPDQISNKIILASFDVVWIANSSKGTIIKLDSETGRLLGEYLSVPQDVLSPYPSRIAVDSKGNAWVANYSHDSIVKIGDPANGFWVDRNGNGKSDTSGELGNVFSWTGSGVAGAADEAILLYVRTDLTGVRQISVDADDNVWASSPTGVWQKFDGRTGALLRTQPSIGQGGNGGYIAGDGKMYSTSSSFLVWNTPDPIASLPKDDNIREHTWASALDSQGNLWTTRDWTSTVMKYSPTGVLLGEYYHGEPWAMGIAIDANDHVWVAHSHCGHSVGHLLPDGTFVGNVEVAVHGPVEVSIDRRGRIWVVSSTGVVERINPLGGPLGSDGVTPIGEVDIKSGNLGGALWTYGRFTGSSLGLSSPDGLWTTVYDGQLAGTNWGPLVWNGEICNDARIEVDAALSANGTAFGPYQTLTVSNPTPSGTGRYLKTRVRLVSSTTGETPELYDLTVGTAGYTPSVSSPSWHVAAGADIKGNWPDIIQLKGAFCHSVHAFPTEPTYAWSVVSAPAGASVNFSSPTAQRPTAQFSAQGTYVLRITATLGSQVSVDDVQVVLTPYNRAPYPNAGYTIFRADFPPQLWLWGSVRDDGLPAGNTVTTQWEKLFGPGTVTFANPTAPETTASFSAPGVYVLKLKANDGELIGEDVTTVWLGFSCIPNAPDGLVAWWQAAGNGDDHIGGNQAFTERGADFVGGRIGGAFRFDGTNDRVRVFSAPSINAGAGGGFTLELWVNPSSARTATMLEYGENTTHGFSLRQIGTAIEANFREANGTAHALTTGAVLGVGSWTHVSVSYDRAAGEARIFINGAHHLTQNVGTFALATAYDIFFGATASNTEFYHGLLDEISVYKRALYADEIAAIATSLAGKRPPVSNVPPAVNAGPELAGKTANTPIALNATVTDDGQPSNGVLVTRWSKVSGPGVATFADESKPQTTVSLSEGGVYVLKLLADDGGFCTEDLVEVRAGPLFKFDTDSSLAAWWTANSTDLDEVRKLKLERFNGLGFGPGKAADGFLFNGTTHYGRVGANPAINLGASAAGMTIEFWAKPTRAQDVPLVIWTTPGGIDGVSVRQWVNGTGLYVFLRDTGGNDHTIAVDGVFAANTWVHVAVTYDKTTGFGRLYRDGIMIREQNIGIFTPQTNYPLVVGALPREGRYYQGVLDEVTFYNRPLGMAEIQAIHEGGVIGKVPLDNNRPPVISAVTSIVASSTVGSVALTSTVNDDGLPAGNIVARSWSKLEGPGIVTFSDPGSAGTAATFSAPGTYVLRFDANDGLNQSQGVPVVVRVGISNAVEPDNAVAAWWPADGDVREVLRGNHDWEFLPRGPGFAPGKVAQGFLFNGTDHYGRTAAHSDLDIGSSSAGLTIEMWVNPSRAQDVPLVMWTTPAGNDGVSLRQWVNGTGLYAYLRDTSGVDHLIAVDGIFASNSWVHVAVTYNKATGVARLYRNGVLISEQNLGIFTPQTSYPLLLGALPREGRYFQGTLDEITFYTRPLSLTDIQAIFDAGVSGKAPLDENQPPVVNAGLDVAQVSPNAPAPLNGTVTDDGRPVGTLTVAWSKVEGPGAVSFLDAAMPSTTATFSQPGTYVLRLDAHDGLNKAQGDTVVVRVGVVGSVEPDGTLAAWWPANGELHDVVHNNHHWEFLPRGASFGLGQVAQGFTFNGIDHYGRLAPHGALDIGNATAGLTIELWVKPSRAQDVPLVMWTTPGGSDGVSLRQWVNGVGLYAYLKDTNGVDHLIAVDGIFSANTWVHVAVTYDQATGFGRLYRNGVLMTEQYLGSFTPQTSYPLLLGALPREGRYFQGTIDEISFYTRPLSMADIQAIYLAGGSGKAPFDNNQPPLVSAGPDVAVLNPAAIVPLKGLVTDDGRPFGGSLAVVWSKVEGPGTVAFADSSAAMTTAGFSVAGTYVLRLDAHDGMHAATPDFMAVRIGTPGVVEQDGALAAWWPANGEVREVVRGNHDWEFLPRGPSFGLGEVGQGFAFNGNDHYGRTPAHSNLNLGMSASGLTIELWVKPSRAQDVPLVIWTTPSGSDGVSFRQWVNGVGLYAYLRDTSGIEHLIAVDGVFASNVWVHVAVTYDKTTGVGRLYRNGVLLTEQNLGVFTPQTSYPLLLGALPREGRYFQGTLDEIGFYTRALSMSDLQSIYQAGVSGKAPLDDNQPPVLSAGPDVVTLDPGAVVLLKGSVTDDGRPVGGGLTIAWSKVEGLGDVAFAQPNAAQTTATFSAPGTYLLRLDAHDAILAAASDTMEVRIGATNTVQSDGALAAWWPANRDVHEVVRGNHDWEFLPRGAIFGPGEVRQGFLFNGVDHYGRTAAHSDLDLGTSAAGLTIEMWVNPSRAQDVPLVIWTTPAGNDGVSLRQWVNGTGLYAYIRDTSGVDHLIAVDGIFASNTWVHVAVTYNKATGVARLYRNGVLISEQNLGIFTPQTSYPLLLGALPREGRYFQGTLDEISFYTRPLSTADIQAVFQAGVSGKTPLAPNISPTVALVSPYSGAAFVINSAIGLTAIATDTDGTIAKVEFFEGLTKIGESTSSQSGQPLSFQLNLSSGFATLGRHVITARATDNVGGAATSGALLLDVLPVLPTVALNAPANGASVPAGSPVTLQATATYSLGAIASVEFYDGPVKLGQSTTPVGSSYSFTVTAGFSAGSHMLTAKAVAADNSTAISAPVLITATTSAPTIALTAPTNSSSLAANTAFTLSANAADSDGTVAKVEFFRGGTKLGEDLAAPFTFNVAAGLPVGAYVLTAKATDNSGLTTESAAVNVNVVTYSGPPVAELIAPTDAARITQATLITGIVAHSSLTSWAVEYRLKAAEGTTAEPWSVLATGNSLVGTPAFNGNPAVPGTLGTFDPTRLMNGIYEVQLAVTGAGATDTVGPVAVLVEGNMKIGAFSVAFEDLKLPVAGIPITITRTYDSRDIRVGDFGPGWRLALNNIRVQKNTNLGVGWTQENLGGELNPVYYLTPLRNHLVTIVMPDGETHRFEASIFVPREIVQDLPDNARWALPIQSASLVFKPIGDTTSTLVPDGQNTVLFTGQLGDLVLTQDDPHDLDPIVYNPKRFRLTTADGSVYLLDEALGLIELRDLSGNTLVLNRDPQNRVTGVTSTQAAPGGAITSSVTIHRNATGRVDYIRDPAGRDLDYIYDAQGRLESFTNRENNVTQFRYENAAFPYYLTKILDPRGVAALRSEYDPATGKLLKQIDADGRETIFNHGAGIDAPTRFEKIKDRLGYETTFFYDERGNVTLKFDPLNAQTTYSYWPDSDRVKFEIDHYGNVKSMAYDAQGNVTVQTIGASLSEDPANPTTGYTTRTVYNSRSAPTQITDPDGRVQTFTYDPASNNLLTHTVGAAGSAPVTTTYTYKSDGTLDVITDALGNTTAHAYNYAFSDPLYPGAVKQITITVTDPAGALGSDSSNGSATVLRVTRSLFDAQENQLAQIVARTLPDGTTEDVITRNFFDAENRIKATIMPDGRVSETRYTSFGKVDKTVLWKSLADYQGGNDANARITSFVYDARGNQTSVTHADATSEATGFDLENRKTWSQDRRGYRTFFVYDAVGRLRFTIHPDANDGVGAAAPASSTDPRLADNPRTETVYDLAGRVTDSYDELRRRTQTVYFADGTPDASRRKQTVAVRGAGNLVTSYQYDKAGNVRFVTDPRGNTVETRYDDQGRPRLVVYPATDEHPSTQAETKYDALGRRVEVVDQEGKITRHRYDALGRLIEVRQYIDQGLAGSDSGFSLAPTTTGIAVTRYAYDGLGNQQTQTDALGRVTTYWTDNLGRRTKRILPKDASESAFLTETLQYDEWGNLWKRTDFAGKTTTFGYDSLNRLKSKTADATHPSLAYSHAIARIEYDYNPNGARSAARTFNASNTQLYTESTPRDERGRLDYKDTASGRLDYDYYANNLLKGVDSSNDPGVSVGYRYDELNRLESVDDFSTGLPTRTTAYTYNPTGSLETVTTPNGAVHTYGYDALNRLRALIVTQGSTLIHTYEYKLRASGHRRQVVEGAKTTTYVYDDLYRLTDETIAGDPNANNGTIGYTLDKVGNRLARNSQLTALNSQLGLTHNARDWLNGDTYTANGSTQSSTQFSALNPPLAGTDTYDFEERLILRTKSDGTTINISYDADGHRIRKNLLNASAQPHSSTTWLVDTNNLTGYAQVLEERVATGGGTTLRVYTYGSDLISQATSLNGQPANLSYFAYDGHGSTRELTSATGAVTDRYDYDAFGNLVFQSGAAVNAYRYCGEHYDFDLGLYSLRARYLNTDSGRFWSMDNYEGSSSDPMSLHKYIYTDADPVGKVDPSGNASLPGLFAAAAVVGNILRVAMPTIARLNTTALYNIYRGTMAAEKVMLAAEYVGVAVGVVGLVATGADSIAQNLLNNSQSITDGPYPEQFKRGTSIDRIGNGNLSGNVSFIDDLDDDGIGTSLRSRNITGGEKALLEVIRDDAREVSGARNGRIYGTTRDGRWVDFSGRNLKGTALVVAIPENDIRITLSPSFRNALRAYSETYKTVIQVVPVKGWRR